MLKPIHKNEELDWSEGASESHKLEKKCMCCRAFTVIKLDAAKYVRWRREEYVQQVWPDWTEDQREMLISGTHADCWEYLFHPEKTPEELFETFKNRPLVHIEHHHASSKDS